MPTPRAGTMLTTLALALGTLIAANPSRSRAGPFEGAQPLPPYVIEPPDVLRIQVGEPLPVAARSITGEHLVRPDGTIRLGAYGCVHVVPMTTDQAIEVIAHQLKRAQVGRKFSIKQIKRGIQVDVADYNSKACYVLVRRVGQDEHVHRFPLTGSETVLDVVGCVQGAAEAAHKGIWVQRRGTDPGCAFQILRVNWKAITQDGDPKTNYQLCPGDRVYIQPIPSIEGGATLGRTFVPLDRILKDLWGAIGEVFSKSPDLGSRAVP